ncbi:MAG TPA: metalloregulator ArsR/SmtB family transcription factor [Dehalococcoidia bacterium]|nr:metalloregulator ArsR/SmtB family transcription factor [Dehalococcoidia bacterium]
MTYGPALQALADPTRRAILERLRGGPSPVGALAAGLPVSRPAVSQHLRVLREAALVAERREGTRNIYSLDPRGLEQLRQYIDSFWDEVLERYKEAVEQDGPQKKEGGNHARSKRTGGPQKHHG